MIPSHSRAEHQRPALFKSCFAHGETRNQKTILRCTPKSFHALFGRIGVWAKMPFPIHPHMLRHGCGYALANAGHDTRALQAWLGHKNIQHTVRYTELAPDRFKNFWR
jgi:site-specific recombinase XerD